jgi:ankyrin repeat protein
MDRDDKSNKIEEIFKKGKDQEILNFLNCVKDLNDEIEGYTPLVWAIIYEREAIVSFLVANDQVDIDKTCGFYFETPMHKAIFVGNKKIVKILFCAGVDLTKQDFWEKTPDNYLAAFPLI